MPREVEDSRYWPVLYVGKPASSQNNGSYIWRLRDELKQALEQTDLSFYPLFEKEEVERDQSQSDLSVEAPELSDELGSEVSAAASPITLEKYTREDFLAEVFMANEMLDRLTGLLQRKKNVILQGAPGVGKTFTAKRLAWLMMGVKDPKRIGSYRKRLEAAGQTGKSGGGHEQRERETQL